MWYAVQRMKFRGIPRLYRRAVASYVVTPSYSLLIVFSLATSVAVLAYPFYVIRPFRPQGARELEVALILLRLQPIITALFAAVAMIAAVRHWQTRPGKWRRIAAIAGAMGVSLCAVLSHVNVFERMFHPMGQPSFASADKVKLDRDEMVMGVSVSGAARAYPIRSVSYHHVVNDIVGDLPIVATY